MRGESVERVGNGSCNGYRKRRNEEATFTTAFRLRDVGIPRASSGIWKTMPRIREGRRVGVAKRRRKCGPRKEGTSCASMAQTQRGPASSISLIRSPRRPPGFRNARHPLLLARPTLYPVHPPPSYTVLHPSDEEGAWYCFRRASAA